MIRFITNDREVVMNVQATKHCQSVIISLLSCYSRGAGYKEFLTVRFSDQIAINILFIITYCLHALRVTSGKRNIEKTWLFDLNNPFPFPFPNPVIRAWVTGAQNKPGQNEGSQRFHFFTSFCSVLFPVIRFNSHT